MEEKEAALRELIGAGLMDVLHKLFHLLFNPTLQQPTEAEMEVGD